MAYTVYMFYRRGSLYAYTMTKEFRDRFIQERNKEKFVEVKKKVSESSLPLLFTTYPHQKLNEIPLNYDQDKYITMIGTGQEEEILSSTADDLEREMNDVEEYFTHLFSTKGSPKKKYENAIFQLTNTSRHEEGVLRSNINMFHLFFHLFLETLVFRESVDEYE